MSSVDVYTLLEESVALAQASLQKSQSFSPFYMLLTTHNRIEKRECDLDDTKEGYAKLEEMLRERVQKGDVEVVVLVVDTTMPQRFHQAQPHSIRLHVEERAMVGEKIGARYLYVPYQLLKQEGSDGYTVVLEAPIPVGFIAEYLSC
jgi:hypothetical protein